MATILKLRWVRSDTRQPAFVILDNDEAAVDLSSASAIVFTVRLASSDAVVLTKTKAAAEIVVSGGSSNVATVTIDAGDTSDWVLTEDAYNYDIQYTIADVVVTPAEGTITITKDQTRA